MVHRDTANGCDNHSPNICSVRVFGARDIIINFSLTNYLFNFVRIQLILHTLSKNSASASILYLVMRTPRYKDILGMFLSSFVMIDLKKKLT